MKVRSVHTVVFCHRLDASRRACGCEEAKLPSVIEWGRPAEESGMIAQRVEWWSGYATDGVVPAPVFFPRYGRRQGSDA